MLTFEYYFAPKQFCLICAYQLRFERKLRTWGHQLQFRGILVRSLAAEISPFRVWLWRTECRRQVKQLRREEGCCSSIITATILLFTRLCSVYHCSIKARPLAVKIKCHGGGYWYCSFSSDLLNTLFYATRDQCVWIVYQLSK